MPTHYPKTFTSQLPEQEITKIINRIVMDVTEYFETFKKPCPMKAISAKYARALRGDFYASIDYLEADRQISVELVEFTAARMVYPYKNRLK